MQNNDNIGTYVLETLKQHYEVIEKDIGSDAKLDKGLMHFTVRSFDIAGIGTLCLLNMRGMLGLMKMETVVISSFTKDVPLLNIDTVSAMGNTTRIAELYDTRIKEKNPRLEKACQAIKDADSDLPDYSSGPHWYDDFRMACTYGKKTKGNDDLRTKTSCMKYFDAYMKELELAEDCDPDAKRKANRVLPDGLLEHGGPAVDQVRKMFGEELASRLILSHMYGVE
jgi:hypothetical protein